MSRPPYFLKFRGTGHFYSKKTLHHYFFLILKRLLIPFLPFLSNKYMKTFQNMKNENSWCCRRFFLKKLFYWGREKRDKNVAPPGWPSSYFSFSFFLFFKRLKCFDVLKFQNFEKEKRKKKSGLGSESVRSSEPFHC